MKRKIFFRADAGAQVGYGHFIRTLALADMLKDEFDCIFYTTNPSTYQIREMSKVCPFVSLRENTKFIEFLTCLTGEEIVVLDNYFYTTDYQRSIKEKGCKLVCIDDMHDKHYVADAIINHGPVTPEEFDCEKYSKLFLGNSYKLLRKPFLLSPSHKPRNNAAVVNLGGADPFKLTDKVISLLLQVTDRYKIVAILGDSVYISNENQDRIEVRKRLSAIEMAELFESSAFGILPASTVSIEAASRGLPMMIGYQVDNQEEGYKKSVNEGNFIPLGNLHQLTKEKLAKAIMKLDGFRPFIPDNTHIQSNFINLFRSL